MTFNKSHTIKNVLKIVIWDDIIFYKSLNGFLHYFYYGKSIDPQCIFNSKIDSLFVNKENKLFFESNRKLYNIDSNLRWSNYLDSKGSSFHVESVDSYFVYYHMGEPGEEDFQRRVKYFEQKKELWDRRINSINIFINEVYIEKDDFEAKVIRRFQIKNFSSLWTYHLPPQIHTYGRFYLVDQVLIFRTNTAHLIGLDIETGKELWRLEKCMPSFQVMEEQKKLIGLQTDLYQVIDPINGEKVIEKRFENLKERYRIWPSSHLANVYPEGLYFVSNYQGTRFGMVDIYNSEIAWVQDHNPEAGRYEGLAAPVLHQDKLYLHEAGKTLYVYERV